jgi:hypothetical protein
MTKEVHFPPSYLALPCHASLLPWWGKVRMGGKAAQVTPQLYPPPQGGRNWCGLCPYNHMKTTIMGEGT